MRRAIEAYDQALGEGDVCWWEVVERLRDEGVAVAGEEVRVWDERVDGVGLGGWRRGVAVREVEGEEEGRERWDGWHGGHGARLRVRERAEGKENVRPVGREREREWDPEAWE